MPTRKGEWRWVLRGEWREVFGIHGVIHSPKAIRIARDTNHQTAMCSPFLVGKGAGWIGLRQGGGGNPRNPLIRLIRDSDTAAGTGHARAARRPSPVSPLPPFAFRLSPFASPLSRLSSDHQQFLNLSAPSGVHSPQTDFAFASPVSPIIFCVLPLVSYVLRLVSSGEHGGIAPTHIASPLNWLSPVVPLLCLLCL